MEGHTIYYMENRGFAFLFHFFMFTIGGLRHCEGKRPRIYIPYLRPSLKEFDRKIVESLCSEEKDLNPTKDFPLDYNWKNLDVHYEICDLLKDKYEFLFTLEDFPNLESYTVVKCHGEPDTTWYKAFPFLKSLFEEIVGHASLNPTQYVYITRKGSQSISLHKGKLVRCILNEEELLDTLTPLGFQCIQLETLSFPDKIRLFQSSKIVLAPNTAALMFCLFSNKDSHIIEMIPRYIVGQYNTHWDQTQYQTMCEYMNLSYTRFQQFREVEDNLNAVIETEALYQCITYFQNAA